MIFERAKNGGGKIYGDHAMVCKDSHLDRDSFVSGYVDIWHSQLIRSTASGGARIRLSTLEDLSEVVDAEVTQSRLIRARVVGGTVTGAYVENSSIEGSAHVRGGRNGVKVVNSVIKDNAIVEGSAIVVGVTLKKRMRVSSGLWESPPRYYDLVNDIADIGITESKDGKAFVGCTEKHMADWIRKRTLWCKAVGWTEAMGMELERVFRQWLTT